MNTHVRDNFLESAAAKVTTAGDQVYATGANALTRVGLARLVDGSVGNHRYVVKDADESVTSSTTLQNDDELLLAIGASEFWFFEIFLMVTCGSATDLKVSITAPASALGSLVMPAEVDGATASHVIRSAFGGSQIHDLQSGEQPIPMIQVWVRNSTNAGNVQLQWAQGTSSVTALTVRAGSFMRCTRLV